MPDVEVPELSSTLPLTPKVPALAVSNDREPLLVAVPEPVVTEMAPPVLVADKPAVMTSVPPVSVPEVLVPAPAAT